VIQLTWARTKRIIRLLPSLTALAQAGWYSVMLGLYFLVLSILLRITFPPFGLWLIGGGVAMVFIFGEQHGGNFLANIGKGFANFFLLFLKSVSCFADIISYIRLFAVGLAGSMISKIFNTMAVPENGLGSFGAAFIAKLVMAAVILVFGHGLNMLLNTLSVIVHGVRLNIMEYAGNHLEMEWSGYEYNPFAVRQKDNIKQE
jgi:V/A-type H+-transporting ATPase subunit I